MSSEKPMPRFKCTRKLLKALGVEPVAQPDAQPTILGDWYGNLLSIARRHVVLFTNESTLYSFAVLGVRRVELRNIGNVFVEHLRLNLAHEDIPVEVIARVEAAYRVMGIARTDSRSVLGSMNDLAVLLEQYLLDPGMKKLDVRDINKELNRTPHKPLGWKCAADVLHERLRGTCPVSHFPERRVCLN